MWGRQDCSARNVLGWRFKGTTLDWCSRGRRRESPSYLCHLIQGACYPVTTILMSASRCSARWRDGKGMILGNGIWISALFFFSEYTLTCVIREGHELRNKGPFSITLYHKFGKLIHFNKSKTFRTTQTIPSCTTRRGGGREGPRGLNHTRAYCNILRGRISASDAVHIERESLTAGNIARSERRLVS